MQYVTAWMDGWRRLLQTDGRASRKGFWSFYLGNMIAVIVLTIMGGIFDAHLATTLAYILGSLATLLAITVAIRRLHDKHLSGWWVLVGLIPFFGQLGLLIFFMLPGDPGPNRYGAQPGHRANTSDNSGAA